ncbi:MAG: hypothetical protein L3J56_06155 [Bacteroidales bacterium]|nr:hypothetical protein [Bacteroidales bacterium]
MKELIKKLRLLVLPAVLIGLGLTAVSQNQRTITDYQLKQIRLLVNQARTDSIKVIRLNKAVDTLNTIISLKDIQLNNCDTIQKLQYEKTEKQNIFINILNDKVELFGIEEKALKKRVRNRTLIIVVSAILNSIFIIKTF